jgi:uracil-DNA glycosylase
LFKGALIFIRMDSLLNSIASCTECTPHLPLGPRPVVSVHPDSRIVIIGQAPGTRVHETGVPWNDMSGDNLRNWMGISKEKFYNTQFASIIPMGFCYPGKGASGDLPPRKECAPLWHTTLFKQFKSVDLILLIGTYAQQYYLKDRMKRTLTETVRNYKDYLPEYFVLPHPSPRNNIWMAKNNWFQKEVLPHLKKVIKEFT